MAVDKKYKEYEEKLYYITDRSLLTAEKVNELFKGDRRLMKNR